MASRLRLDDREALAPILVPSMATTPTLPNPIFKHRASTWANRPLRASSWALRNRAIVTWSGVALAETTRKATSS